MPVCGSLGSMVRTRHVIEFWARAQGYEECEHQATLLHASYSISSREIGSIVTLEATFRPSKKTKSAHTVGCV